MDQSQRTPPPARLLRDVPLGVTSLPPPLLATAWGGAGLTVCRDPTCLVDWVSGAQMAGTPPGDLGSTPASSRSPWVA